MTFSIAARCAESGQFGVAISSSSICVASRCAFARSGIGAALTQNVTDPRLGMQLLDLLAEDHDAESAIAQVTTQAEHIEWRQLALIDAQGRSHTFSGEKILGQFATASGANCVSAGNLLANTSVPQAIVDGFAATNSSNPLAERLLTALQTGLKAGGEAGPVHSAGLMVVADVEWPVVDLRVDWHNEPIDELRRLWHLYEPQLQDYRARALDPNVAPSYGVPGDP